MDKARIDAALRRAKRESKPEAMVYNDSLFADRQILALEIERLKVEMARLDRIPALRERPGETPVDRALDLIAWLVTDSRPTPGGE